MAVICCVQNGRQIAASFPSSVGAVGRRGRASERIGRGAASGDSGGTGEQLILSDITPWTFRDDIRVKPTLMARQTRRDFICDLSHLRLCFR